MQSSTALIVSSIIVWVIRVAVGGYLFSMLWSRLKAAESPAQGRRENAFLVGFLVAYALMVIILPILEPLIENILAAFFCPGEPAWNCSFNRFVLPLVFPLVYNLIGVLVVWRLSGRWQGLLGYISGCVVGWVLVQGLFALLRGMMDILSI